MNAIIVNDYNNTTVIIMIRMEMLTKDDNFIHITKIK